MTTILAVTKLYDDVVARFALDASPTQTVTFTPDAIVNGTAYGLTIAGHAVSKTAGPTDDFASVAAALYTAITALGLSIGVTMAAGVMTLVRRGAATIAYTAAVHGALADATPAGATPVVNKFGWREVAKRGTPAPRIVWVPGDDASGALGDIGGSRAPGRLPERPLATLHELLTVYVEGFDATGPEDERKQYAATRALFDSWYRAAYLAAHGTFALRSAGWVIDKLERRHGAAIRVVLSVDAMIPDAPRTTAPVDVGASNTPVLSIDGDAGSDEADTTVPDVIAAA